MKGKILLNIFFISVIFLPQKIFPFQLNEKTFKNLNNDAYEIKSLLEQLKVNSNIDDSKMFLWKMYMGNFDNYANMTFTWLSSPNSLKEKFPKPVCEVDYKLWDKPHSEDLDRTKDTVKCPIASTSKPLSIGPKITPILIFMRENLKPLYEQFGEDLNKKYKNLWPIPFEQSPSYFGIGGIKFKESGPTFWWHVEAKTKINSPSDKFSCHQELSWNQSKISPNPKISCDND